MHGGCTGVLDLYYDFQFSVFVGFLEVQTSGSLCVYLFLVPYLGLFSFCLLVLSCSNVLVFVYFYSILFYYYPLEACFFVFFF